MAPGFQVQPMGHSRYRNLDPPHGIPPHHLALISPPPAVLLVTRIRIQPFISPPVACVPLACDGLTVAGSQKPLPATDASAPQHIFLRRAQARPSIH